MALTGFYYFWSDLGMDDESYAFHYDFNDQGSTLVPTSANTNPIFTGELVLANTLPDFYPNAGSGFFSGDHIEVQNCTGLDADFWTHIIIYERASEKGGILFDSLQTGDIVSGYRIGVNDANKLYFEAYNNHGYYIKTSNIMYGVKNLAAITKAANSINFYNYDFNNADLESDSFRIDSNFLQPSSKANIGSGFTGYIDEYVYLKEAMTNSTLKCIMSGFFAEYGSAPSISTFTTNEITGYSYVLTGVTGVTGYSYGQVSGGVDSFGDPIYTYSITALTGYLTSGSGVINLTGSVINYITGNATGALTIDSSFASGFGLDEVSYLRKIDYQDISFLKALVNTGASQFNKVADYDSIEAKFELDDVYSGNQVSLFINGLAQFHSGADITGDYYNNGIVLQADYVLTGFLVDSTGFYYQDDFLIFDTIDSVSEMVVNENIQSGYTESLLIESNKDFFLNGQLMMSGIDYVSSGGYYMWFTDRFDGESGRLFSNKYEYTNFYKTR